jgi:senataxin
VVPLNARQQEAVTAAATQTGFVLVQGPPGTGKTNTIVAMILAVR